MWLTRNPRSRTRLDSSAWASAVRTNERQSPRTAGSPAPLVRRFICLVALSRDRKPQEEEPEENKQGLKDEVHLCIRKMMEAKDPMDPDDIEARHEAGAREHAPKERGRCRSLAPKQKPNERRDRDCEYCDLSSRRSDRIQRERKDQIGLRVVDLTKSSGGGQAEVQGRCRPFVYLQGQSRTGQQTNKERAGPNSLAPLRLNGGAGNASSRSVNCKHVVHPAAYEPKITVTPELQGSKSELHGWQSGAQIFDRRCDPKHGEDENAEVINPHREHHAGTHRSHIHHHALPPTPTIQRGLTIGIERSGWSVAPSLSSL